MYATWLVAPVPMIANWDPIANSWGMSGRYFSMIFIRFLGRFVSHLTRFQTVFHTCKESPLFTAASSRTLLSWQRKQASLGFWRLNTWILAYLVSLSNSNRNSMDFLHKRKMPIASVVYILKKNLQILKLTLPDVIFPTAGGNFWKCPSPHFGPARCHHWPSPTVQYQPLQSTTTEKVGMAKKSVGNFCSVVQGSYMVILYYQPKQYTLNGKLHKITIVLSLQYG